MLGTRHEEYAKIIEGFPFLLNVNLNRNENLRKLKGVKIMEV